MESHRFNKKYKNIDCKHESNLMPAFDHGEKLME